MAAGAPSPVEQSERSLTAARAQEMLLLEEEKRRLEASRLRYAAAVPLPPDAGSPGGYPPSTHTASRRSNRYELVVEATCKNED